MNIIIHIRLYSIYHLALLNVFPPHTHTHTHTLTHSQTHIFSTLLEPTELAEGAKREENGLSERRRMRVEADEQVRKRERMRK